MREKLGRKTIQRANWVSDFPQSIRLQTEWISYYFQAFSHYRKREFLSKVCGITFQISQAAQFEYVMQLSKWI